jgi:hypothetical protein
MWILNDDSSHERVPTYFIKWMTVMYVDYAFFPDFLEGRVLEISRLSSKEGCSLLYHVIFWPGGIKRQRGSYQQIEEKGSILYMEFRLHT